MLMLALAIIAPVQAPPPLLIGRPTPVIMATPRPTALTGDAARRRIRLEVTIRSADAVLWRGTLLVADRGQSSWNQARSEPDDEACGREAYRFGESEALSLQLTLPPAGQQTTDRVNVVVRWSRAAETPCAGTRIVELRQAAAIPDRGGVTISGDGGLVVELRRR